MSSLEEERREQARWRLRPKFANVNIFDRLVEAEFLPEEQQDRATDQRLRQVIRYAVNQIPYYRDLFARRGIDSGRISHVPDLPLLPPLSKRDVYDENDRLQPEQLPDSQKVMGVLSSSGTTGRPARVVQTVANNEMFAILSQRQLRWFRWDPQGTFATIRLGSQLPRGQSGAVNPEHTTQRLPAWRYAGHFFHTGPAYNFNVTNEIDGQVGWLRDVEPDYLMSYSETLEHLVLASEGENPCPGVKGLFAISEQLTESMRRLIEGAFGAPVDQNYGLNEIGLAAVRCRAGRYHTHTEHCAIEIADDDGNHCAPGETGHILITGFNNAAMPLIRYDTGDMAKAVEGPCPCGRTLPSFGEIVGRYSRIAFLPEGTLGYVGAVRETLEAMPQDIIANLRQFQIHQFRDNRFELRIIAAGPMHPAFAERIDAAWQQAVGAAGHPLAIVAVNEIERSPGGKFQDFTSDFMPKPSGDDETDSGRSG